MLLELGVGTHVPPSESCRLKEDPICIPLYRRVAELGTVTKKRNDSFGLVREAIEV